MSEQLEYFTVVRVWFSVGTQIRDPHVPDQKQYHHGVFVRTRKNGSGILHHAAGDVTSQGGMRYEAKERDDVIRSQNFDSQQTLGYIPASSYPQLEQILRSCQTPPQQKAFNTRRMTTEPFKSSQPLTFYTADELKNFQFPRLKKCKWWVEDQALPALQRSRLLVQNPPSSSRAQQPSSSHASSAGGSHAPSAGGNGKGHTASEWVWDASHRRYRYFNGREWVWQ